ncbi:MAG: hypothetical protein HYW88_00785, partial [Candidatus Sungbacteria bacterium]|nr:hypothetical protein [Candidatus Sungbacteria bacterium]
MEEPMDYHETKYLFSALMTAREWFRLKSQGCPVGNLPQFRDLDATWVDERAEIGSGTLVFPGCVIMGQTVIGKNCVIFPGATLLNVEAEDNVTIAVPHLKNCKLGRGASVGALAELNRTELGKDVKMFHLGYLGDTVVGDRSNIGAGTITANFDGRGKNKTVLGPDTFTGIHSSIIAPNELPEGTYIAAHSVIPANAKDKVEGGIP